MSVPVEPPAGAPASGGIEPPLGRVATEGGTGATVIRRFRRADGMAEAVYSPCLRWRYALTLDWGDADLSARDRGRNLLMVMLNPSTATELRNDPTIERCERRARALGYGALRVVNLFAFRATDPRDLLRQADPVGPDNDAALRDGMIWADRILCGWGAHGGHQGRDARVEAMLRAGGLPLWHLGLTRAGAPRHPLYIGYAMPLQPWVAQPRE